MKKTMQFDTEALEDVIAELGGDKLPSISRQAMHNWRKGIGEPTFSKMAVFLKEASKILGRKLKFDDFVKKV